MSKKALVIIGAAIVASAIAAHVAGRMHSNAAWLAFGVPSFLLSGWAFAGHLMTLDDDAPDGFSNVDGSRSFWRSSLTELVAKGALFLFVAVTVISGGS